MFENFTGRTIAADKREYHLIFFLHVFLHDNMFCVLLRSTQNTCFHGEIRQTYFLVEKSTLWKELIFKHLWLCFLCFNIPLTVFESFQDSFRMIKVLCKETLYNSPYLENYNFETCAPRMFKLHAFGSLPTTKKCWIFELDMLSSSGVMDVQNIYRTYNKTL